MGVISIFPLPVYMKKAEDDQFDNIQEEDFIVEALRL